MSRALLWKLAAILALTLGLTAPLHMAENLVGERRVLRDRVMQDSLHAGDAAAGLVCVAWAHGFEQHPL